MNFSLKIIFFLFLTGFEKYFPNGKNGKKTSEPKEVMGEKKGTVSKDYILTYCFPLVYDVADSCHWTRNILAEVSSERPVCEVPGVSLGLPPLS